MSPHSVARCSSARFRGGSRRRTRPTSRRPSCSSASAPSARRNARPATDVAERADSGSHPGRPTIGGTGDGRRRATTRRSSGLRIAGATKIVPITKRDWARIAAKRPGHPGVTRSMFATPSSDRSIVPTRAGMRTRRSSMPRGAQLQDDDPPLQPRLLPSAVIVPLPGPAADRPPSGRCTFPVPCNPAKPREGLSLHAELLQGKKPDDVCTRDGKPLASDYDEDADVLYLWTGEGPRKSGPSTYETRHGHLVQARPGDARVRRHRDRRLQGAAGRRAKHRRRDPRHPGAPASSSSQPRSVRVRP